ncbi:LOW QUALITY PROTEIN: N(6)-adenosine-methyltransferase catalytic subunit METTL3 [Ammospiza maritima maritima]
MSDTWSSIQAHKKQLDSLRERLQRRRKQDPLGAADPRHDLSLATPPRTSSPAPSGPDGGVSSLGSAPGSAPSPPVGGAEGVPGEPPEPDPALERRLLLHLSDLATPLPTDASAIRSAIAGGDAQVTLRAVESLLHKFAAQELIEVRRGLLHDGPALVTCADHSKLAAMAAAAASLAGRRRGAEPAGGAGGGAGEGKEAKRCRRAAAASDVDLEIESLLSQQSTKEQQSKKVSQEILELLNTTTAKEQSIVEKFRSRGRAQVQEFCDHGTKEECVKASGGDRPCRRLHFRRIINKHTDESLGDCSFLNTCFHMDTCKYVHYEIDACAATPPPQPRPPAAPPPLPAPGPAARGAAPDAGADRLFPPQRICCDFRYLDVSILDLERALIRRLDLICRAVLAAGEGPPPEGLPEPEEGLKLTFQKHRLGPNGAQRAPNPPKKNSKKLVELELRCLEGLRDPPGDPEGTMGGPSPPPRRQPRIRGPPAAPGLDLSKMVALMGGGASGTGGVASPSLAPPPRFRPEAEEEAEAGSGCCPLLADPMLPPTSDSD